MSPRAKPQTTRVATRAEIPDKMYFRIGEVASIVDVKPYVLRYWETEFPALRPQKSRSRQRMYRRRDVELLLKIKHLLYERKYTIAGARQLMKSGINALPEPAALQPVAPVAATASEVANEVAGTCEGTRASASLLSRQASAAALAPSNPDSAVHAPDPEPVMSGWQVSVSTSRPAALAPLPEVKELTPVPVDNRDQLSFDLRVPLAMRADLQQNLRSMIAFCDEADAQDRDPFDQLRKREGRAGTASIERVALPSDG